MQNQNNNALNESVKHSWVCARMLIYDDCGILAHKQLRKATTQEAQLHEHQTYV